ncbi:nitronate monooxygenase (plasmid) [Pseudomonas silvicola]|nr:nitronate monooxygenase [Pseudomonas silvicola]
MLQLGANGVQLGTAFVLCPESAANAAYRAAMKQARATGTEPAAISGRQARCLRNDFCDFSRDFANSDVPDYPLTYSLGKALAAVAAAESSTPRLWRAVGWAGERRWHVNACG